MTQPAFTTPAALPINAGARVLKRAPVGSAPPRPVRTSAAPSAILRRRIASAPSKGHALPKTPATPASPASVGVAAPAVAEVSASDGAVATKTPVKTTGKTTTPAVPVDSAASALEAAPVKPSEVSTKPVPAATPKTSAAAVDSAASVLEAAPVKLGEASTESVPAATPKTSAAAVDHAASALEATPVKPSEASTKPVPVATPKTSAAAVQSAASALKATPLKPIEASTKPVPAGTPKTSEPPTKATAPASEADPVKNNAASSSSPAKAAASVSKTASARPAVSPQAPLACGAGVSNHKNTSKAAKEAFASALAALPEGCVPDLAIVSATSDRGGGVIVNAFKLALGKIPFIGSTTCGAVLTTDGPVKRGMSVMLLSSPGSFATASAEFGSGDVSEAVTTAANELKSKVDGKPVKAVYMTASPGNEETVMRSIHKVFGNEVPIIGGSAADEDVSGMWRIFADGKRFPAGVAMLAIVGDAVKVGACINSPYTPSRQTMTVTGAEGRRLLSLNDRPAADILHKAVGYPIYFEYKNGGAILGQMSTRPYALKRGDEYLSVHVASIDQPSGAVNLFAEAEVGDELVQMENVGGGDSVNAAGIAIEESFKGAMEAGGIANPKAALLMYCGGLGIAVGDKLESNMTGNFASLPLPAAALGMNAFGEQGPSKNGVSRHWNLSVGMLLLE